MQKYSPPPVNRLWCRKLVESPFKSSSFFCFHGYSVCLPVFPPRYELHFWCVRCHIFPQQHSPMTYSCHKSGDDRPDLTPDATYAMAPNLGCEWEWITVWAWVEALTLRWSLEQVVLPQYKTWVMNKTGVGRYERWLREEGADTGGHKRGEEGLAVRLTEVVVFQEAWKV